jgi:hypothetical protein
MTDISEFKDNETMNENMKIEEEINYDSPNSRNSTSQSSENEEKNELKKDKIIKLARSISDILTKIISRPIKNLKKKSLRDSFTGKSIPNISLYDYIIRILNYTEIEENTIISSLIYIDMFDKKKQITKFNVHRIFFCSILISLKYNEDIIYKNEYYAQVAGISLNELNTIEYEFISLLNFNLYIDYNLFNDYKQLFLNNIE